MEIFNYIDNRLKKRENLCDSILLDQNKKSVISFVGGGGKTTFIFKLAEELKHKKKKIIITTTTKMFMSERYFLNSCCIEEIKKNLNDDGIVVLGKPIGNNKFTALEYDISCELMKICDFMLVEADGSRRLPLKAPADYEPDIHKMSNIVIGVAGIDALGKIIKEVCHRKERVCKLLKKDEDHVITERDIAYILSSDKGQMKNVNLSEHDIRYIAVINKCDNYDLLIKAEAIARILDKKEIRCVITALNRKTGG